MNLFFSLFKREEKPSIITDDEDDFYYEEIDYNEEDRHYFY
ncbi:hypothetical protein ACUXCC_004533 [Cytobacillus horneckiae]|nr:hypothetical protein [Cytobacillus horneckiae]MEC1156778.1 hypothetical protein [Cytobacillus horneckiae]MED2940538.1 hypothetical protein [Cytobacillus horneckiae]